jgi:hypothetical protein
MKNMIALLVLSGAVLSLHAETAITTKATELQAQGRSDAATVATLPANTKVEVLRAVGAWREVKASGQTGWVNMFSLKPESSGASASGGNSLGGLGKLLTGGRTSNDATVGTAVKGLKPEDVKNAQPNEAEFQKMQKYAVNKSAGQSFAQRAKLTATKVEYLAEPAPVRAEPTSINGG